MEPSFPQFPLKAGRRGCARLRLRLPAELLTLGGKTRGWLHDISCTGARLGVTPLPDAYEGGILSIAGIEAFGTIIWVRGEFCALHFDQPLSHATVSNLRHHAATFPEAERRRHDRAVRDWVEGRRRIA